VNRRVKAEPKSPRYPALGTQDGISSKASGTIVEPVAAAPGPAAKTGIDDTSAHRQKRHRRFRGGGVEDPADRGDLPLGRLRDPASR